MGGMQETIEQYVTRLQTLAGDDPFSILRATPDRLAALLARLEPALLARRVDPDKWSIAEIAAHLADAELVVAYRARTILAENAAPIAAYDQNAWAASLEYASQDAFVSARLFAAYRMGTLRVADAVDPARLDHYGVHQERGRETVRQLLRLAAGHDVNHLRQIEAAVNRLASGESAWAARPQKPEVPLDLIERIDLRVGTIVEATEVPDADRLAQLTVEFGIDRRQVIAGIRRERPNLASIVGRQALFYYNVPRKKIRGLTSEAMLCDAGYADGLLPAFLVPERGVPNGTRAG